MGNVFAQSKVPIEYSYRLTNRFINLNGDAEKIQGLQQIGNTLTGAPTVTGLHEHVSKSGVTTLLASENGNIWRLNQAETAWTKILTGKTASVRLNTVQMNDKLIFTNGVDRNFYTDDGGNNFSELRALMLRGTGSSTSTSAAGLSDANVTNWLTSTFIVPDDLVYNSTRGAYGIITSVGSTTLQHTTIGSAGLGLGHPTITASANQQTGDTYQIIDLVSLNIIPQNGGLDNFATGTTGTSAAGVAVSGVNWTATEVKAGDFLYNTTRSAVAMVSAVTTAQITHTPITGQTANDSFEFFKSAMPIATWAHVHYGRAYYIDARDQSKVRVTGPNDPQDLSTYQRTLEAISLDYGAYQPDAEKLLSLKTFQSYLVAAGQHNVYADSGITSIQDTSADAVNFTPVGLFPQGAVSRYGMDSIGGTMMFMGPDGLRNFAAVFFSGTFQTTNVSEAIKNDLIAQVASKITDSDEIITIHYPKRNWLLCKVGDVIYNYNFSPNYDQGQINSSPYGSWSTFTTKLAECKCFFVRKNGDFVCAGAGGKIYQFDGGSYDDDGDPINTILETGWLTLDEPQQSTQYRSGIYIRPQFEAGTPVAYTITATGDYQELSSDTVIVTAQGVGEVGFAVVGTSPIGGSRILNDKVPLRWKGKQFKIRIETNDTNGPDILTGFTIYGNVLGKI